MGTIHFDRERARLVSDLARYGESEEKRPELTPLIDGIVQALDSSASQSTEIVSLKRKVPKGDMVAQGALEHYALRLMGTPEHAGMDRSSIMQSAGRWMEVMELPLIVSIPTHTVKYPSSIWGETSYDHARRSMRLHLVKMTGLRDEVLKAKSIDDVHRMRGSVRVMRSLMKFYSPCWEPGYWNDARTRLAKIGTALGDMRDVDVDLAQLAELREGASQRENLALDVLDGVLQKQREEYHGVLHRTIQSEEYEEAVRDLHERLLPVYSEKQADDAVKCLDIADYVGTYIPQIQNNIRTMRGQPGTPIPDIHPLRAASKHLRYAYESLIGTPSETKRDMSKALLDIQNIGERLNDLYAFEKTLTEKLDIPFGEEVSHGRTQIIMRLVSKQHKDELQFTQALDRLMSVW